MSGTPLRNPLERSPIPTSRVAACTHCLSTAVGNVQRETRCVEQHSQAEAISWNSRAGAGGQEEAAGVTMARDICHAWLHSPLLTIGPGDQAVLSFISLPSFPGTLLSLTMGLLSPPRFLPTFNPSKLLLFRPLLSVSARKQNLFETATIHLPPSASVCHYDFLALSLAACSALCMSVSKPSLYAVYVFESKWEIGRRWK